MQEHIPACPFPISTNGLVTLGISGMKTKKMHFIMLSKLSIETTGTTSAGTGSVGFRIVGSSGGMGHRGDVVEAVDCDVVGLSGVGRSW